jgi:Ca-activated chloride channel family protein
MTRLEQGLSIARESILNAVGSRFATVIGRSRGYLAVPLSYDSEAILNFIDSLDILSITGRSTNLESLVETAALSFSATSAAQKIIVLISDGESHSGMLRRALNYCTTNDIIVTTIAVGSSEGALVPMIEGSLFPETISKRDTVTLRLASDRTGGIYIDANREDASSVLSAYLLSTAQEIRTGNRQTEPKQHQTLFVILALITYSAFKFVPRISIESFFSSKNKFHGKPQGSMSFVSVIAVVLILSSCSKGKMLLLEANYLASHNQYNEAIIPYLRALHRKDAAPYAEYGLGLTFYSLDENTAALKHYDNSVKMLKTLSDNKHHELQYRIYYNTGIIYFEEGNFKAAADAFKEALRVAPEKLGAKRNLELSLISITMEKSGENGSESRNGSREIVFDYIKQQEQQFWKSREWAEEENFGGPDY